MKPSSLPSGEGVGGVGKTDRQVADHMFNSGLAFALTAKYFASLGLTRLFVKPT